jgi:flavorubredoxin
VLTRGCRLEAALENYRVWSLPQINSQFTIPIFYCSAYGCTEQIGRAVREGILEARPRALCELYDLVDCDMAAMGTLLNLSDAFLLGSPTINRDAVPPMWDLLSRVDAVNIVKRSCALFGSYGWSGEAVPNIAGRLELLKCRVFGERVKVCLVPSEEDLAQARAFGRRFAESL